MKVNRLKRDGPGYPDILSEIPDAPKEIFWLGAPPEQWLSRPKLAIVGSRKISGYGKQVTERLVKELTEAGVVIISGLAYGVDSVAHMTALANEGTTIAVLPTSLDRIYPAAHANLAGRISAQGGTLISEYPVGSDALRYQFTARNRIVSGLSDGVLIVEAALNSGTMSTARFALEQGKTVMAVPGNITSPTSEGTNNLIKSGALPITGGEDIMFALKIPTSDTKRVKVFRGTEEEEKVLEAIRRGVGDQEELALILKLDGQAINSILTVLEINGHIRTAGGGYWLPG